jgi:hypothetical protein
MPPCCHTVDVTGVGISVGIDRAGAAVGAVLAKLVPWYVRDVGR